LALGDEFATVLDESVEKIKTGPAGFSPLETLPPELGYRRLRMPHFPYLVVYRHSGELIEIVAVAHTSREPNYWLRRQQ
jgi:plasmid stabilization system protein ParE